MTAAAQAASDGTFARPILAKFGPLRNDVGAEYLRRWRKRPIDANTYLRTCAEHWDSGHQLARRVRDLDDLELWARKLAEECARYGVEQTCETYDFDWRAIPGSARARQLRGEDFQHWRRVLRRVVSQWWDQFMRLAGFVHKHRQVYCSDQCHRWVRQRDDANRRTLADMLMVSDQAESQVRRHHATPGKRRPVSGVCSSAGEAAARGHPLGGIPVGRAASRWLPALARSGVRTGRRAAAR